MQHALKTLRIKNAKGFFYFGIFLGTTFLLIIVSLFNATSQHLTQSEAASAALPENQEFVSAFQAYQSTPSSQNKSALISSAKHRKAVLQSEMYLAPQKAINAALPLDIRNSLPEDVQPYIEQPITTTGEVGVIHQDNFWNESATDTYFLLTQNKTRYALHFSPGQQTPAPKAQVQIDGLVVDTDVAITSFTTLQQVSHSAAAAPHINVVLLNFTNGGANASTQSDLKAMIEGSGAIGENSVNDFYNNSTFGQIQFKPTYYGPVNVPMAGDQICYDGPTIENQITQAVNNSGTSIDTSSNRVYVLNVNISCNPSAFWEQVPGVPYSIVVTTPNGYLAPNVLAHELGHSLLLHHANLAQCTTPNDYTNCTSAEYGGWYEVMGNLYLDLNAPHEEYLGILTASNIQTITTNGTYTVEPIENSNGIKTLKIKKDSQYYYYIEYRRVIGQDAVGGTSYWAGIIPHDGVVINYFDGQTFSHTYAVVYDETYLTKTSKSGRTVTVASDHEIMQDGNEFYDKTANVAIKQLSHDNNKATVAISFSGPNISSGPTPTIHTTPTPSPTGVHITESPTPPHTTVSPHNTQPPSPLPTREITKEPTTLSVSFDNISPVATSKKVTVEFYDTVTGLLNTTSIVTLSKQSDGTFQAPLALPESTHEYIIKIKSDGYLRRQAPRIAAIDAGQINVELVSGDVNGDNTVDIGDYTTLAGCLSNSSHCGGAITDLNGDGKTDILDYNTLLSTFSQNQGQ